MKVSVVIATRNAERTIEKCLQSVRHQNFPDVEIVVVDNDSTDDTVAVARRFADVVMLGGPERSSQRNAGADAASGDVVVFVDADMVLEPGVVRDAATQLRNGDTAGVVIPERSFGDGFWARCKALEKLVALEDPAVEAARAFRRDDFLAVSGYDEDLVACEDWDLADRVTEAAGAAPGRTRSMIWHDEGRLRLRTTFRKKRYYGHWVAAWLETAPEHRRRRSIRAGARHLLRQPVTTAGLLAMKLVEFVGFVAGMVDARRSGDARPARPRGTAGGDGAGAMRGAGVAALVAATMVQTWFRAGYFVASGDNGPWMRNLHGVTRSWSDSLTGTGSSGYPSASLIEAFLHDALTAVGMSDTLAQRLWYSLVLAVCAASVGYLTAAFTKRASAVAAAGLVAVLAPFHVTTLPNILPLVSIAAIALICGIIARVREGRHVPAATAAFVAVWASPLAKNPPLLVIVGAATVLAVAVAVVARRAPVARRLGSLAAWFGAASLFWVVPLVVHYALHTPGLTIVAQTDVEAWAWTQRNSGPGNVVTLVASWVWGDPDILPATATLSRAPWNLLRWALPLSVLLAVPLARSRRRAGVLATVGAVLVVLCVGLNAPFGALNRLLLDHVPGFWLFRQPMSKFGVGLVLVYAVLVGLGIDGAFTRWAGWSTVRRRAAGAAAVVLAACVVAFAFPMYTGAVIPGQRGGREALPPARVAVPASWYDAGRWLDDAPLPGSVMVLPLSEYYQRGTTWGYYGVDDLLWRITDRRALYVLPGGYYEPAGSSPELMAALQDAVAVGDRVGTTRLMDALGVSYLAIRTDFRRTPGRTFADGRALVDAADGNTALRLDRAFEYVHMYSARGASAAERGTDRGTVSTTATRLDVASGTSADRLADIIAATPPGTEIVPDDGQPGTATAWKPTSGVASRSFPTEAGDHLVSARARSAPVWQATRTRHGEMTTVSVELASTLSLDGRPVIHAVPVVLEAGVAPAALDVGGQLVTLADSPVFFEADSGATVRLLGSGETTKLSSGSAELGNCNNARHVGLDEAGIRSEPLPGGASLMAASGSACLSFPAPTPTEISASPLGAPVWHVHAEYERTAGAATRVCLWLPRANACAVGNPPGIGARSGIIDFVAAPGHGDDPTGASLVLYSDHQDGIDDRPSAVTFHDVSVGALTTVGTTGALPRIDTTGEVRDLPGGTTTFTANARLTADLLGRVDPTVSDCHDYDDASDAENALSARALPGGRGRGVELSARRHSACVSGAVQVAPGIRHITIAFQHRNVAGSGGRWCLMGRDDTCAVSGALPASDSWRWFTKDVTLPAFDPFDRAASGSYRLYLYSDGAGPGITPGPATVTDYREVSVRNTYPIVAIAQPVRQPTGQATIRLDEGYAPEWSVSGLPAGVTARHEVVDGWANAWVVDGLAGRRARVTFHYWPDRIVGIAVWSLVPVLAAAVFSLFRHRRRRSQIDLTGSAA